MSNWTRRGVVKAGVAAAGASLVPRTLASRLSRAGDDRLGVGVIGCGGRGTGAAVNALEAHPSTRIVAMADLFRDRLEGARQRLMSHDLASRVEVTPERSFVGFEAYTRLLAREEVDCVILATPPHFRPSHFEASVGAGKHVFMEKPVAVDPVGVRTVIEAGGRAAREKLSVVAGTQRRHQANYLAAMERLGAGAIGDVVSARCYWNQGGLWVHERRPDYSDMEWQCRNWLYFCWLSGDHICEQHVHNLDVINWVKGGPPARAMGMGGREVRTDPKYGNIFDHFTVEYEYPDGMPLLSMCRQIDGCAGRVEEVVDGARGRLTTRHEYSRIEGDQAWEYAGPTPNPYVVEHEHLIASIRGEGTYLNEARRVAESTLTAIMGRLSAYTGKVVTWEQAMGSSLSLSPPSYDFGDLPVRPVPTPGRTPLE